MLEITNSIGQSTGAITMPVIAGASTYAIYKVFVQHFESGGTFLWACYALKSILGY